MASLNELSNLVENYRSDSISLDDFFVAFEKLSRVMFSEDQGLVDAILAIDEALSLYREKELTRQQLKVELANAVRPFASMMYLAVGDMIEIELPSEKKSFEVDVRVRSLAKAAAKSSHRVFAQVA